jgi:hypothetical protein
MSLLLALQTAFNVFTYTPDGGNTVLSGTATLSKVFNYIALPFTTTLRDNFDSVSGTPTVLDTHTPNQGNFWFKTQFGVDDALIAPNPGLYITPNGQNVNYLLDPALATSNQRVSVLINLQRVANTPQILFLLTQRFNFFHSGYVGGISAVWNAGTSRFDITATLYRFDAGVGTVLTSFVLPVGWLSSDLDFHTMALESIGTTFRLYIDGIIRCGGVDATYSTGQIGFLSGALNVADGFYRAYQFVGQAGFAPQTSGVAVTSKAFNYQPDGGAVVTSGAATTVVHIFAPMLLPNVAEVQFLKIILNKVAQENQTLKLFANNITPSQTDAAGTFTEVSGGGYAAKSLVAAGWTVGGGNPGTAVHTTQTFSFTGTAGLVYGYFLVGASSGLLYWAERFTDGPYDVAAGDVIENVIPQFTLQ